MINIDENEGSGQQDNAVPPLPASAAPAVPVKRKRGRPPKIRPAEESSQSDAKSMEIMGITQMPAKRPYHRRSRAEEEKPFQPRMIKSPLSYLSTDKPSEINAPETEQPAVRADGNESKSYIPDTPAYNRNYKAASSQGNGTSSGLEERVFRHTVPSQLPSSSESVVPAEGSPAQTRSEQNQNEERVFNNASQHYSRRYVRYGGRGRTIRQYQSHGSAAQHSSSHAAHPVQPRQEAPAKPAYQVIDIAALEAMPENDLLKLGSDLGIENAFGIQKKDLILKINQEQQLRRNGYADGEGVLEILSDGFGFLRSKESYYLASSNDIYVAANQIKKLELRKGDYICGTKRPPKNGERFAALLNVKTINGVDISQVVHHRRIFEKLTPLHPRSRFYMETEKEENTGRVIDLLVPIGKGQRQMIVAAPKSGKTMILQSIANSLITNHPDIKLMVLLIDERPEEVTDMKRFVMNRSKEGEVIASTFDEPAERHVQVSEIVLERAKRLVELGQDVVILLDSITRLARAYNTVSPSSGRVLSGGLESTSLQRPKRFFGAARNIEEGGSLTIIATALVETGSRMDDVIFEEFKGTGNSEIYLDRKIADRRVFPAIDINRTSTRKEELLMTPEELNKVWILRKVLAPLSPIDSMELLLSKLKVTKCNKDFLTSMAMGGR